MHSQRIAMLGAGNMGGSMLAGMIKNGFDPKKISVFDPSLEKLTSLKKTYHLNTAQNNQEAIESADCIILAVKPQMMHEIANEIATFVKNKKPLILSIAAGLSLSNFENWFNRETPIVRVMPNTAALIGCSASALFANESTSKEQRLLAEKIVNAIGTSVWVTEEQQMDTVTALSGNGPAYFFLLIEVLENAAEKLGLPKNIAHQLAKQTALGAAKLACASSEDMVTLRKQVTSPGGTTEAATKILEDNHIRDIFLDALKRSNERAKELSALFKG